MNLPTAVAGTRPRVLRRWLTRPRAVVDGAAATLFRDGLSLTLSAGLTAIAGMIAWVVAARLLPRAEVGQASAFVSGFLLVAGLGDLGLGSALMRWVPRAGRQRRPLVLRCYAIVLVVSTLVAATVLVLPTGDEIKESVPRYGAVLFMFAAVSWALFQFQDSVLISLGRASWVPYENASIGVARMLVLAALGPLLGALGILVSWVVPAVIGVAVISVLILRTLARSPVSPAGAGVVPDRREVVRLLVPMYPAKVFGSILTDLIPLLITARFGPAEGAVFFVVWMAGNTVDFTMLSFAQSVIVRLAHEPGRTAELFWLGCRRAAGIFLPLLVLGVFIAHPVLSIFGHTYAHQGSTLLRLVLLGSVPRGFTTLVVGLNIAHGRGGVVALLEAAATVGVVTVAAAPAVHGLNTVGYGFVVVQFLVMAGALVIVTRQLTRLRPHPRTEAC